MENRVFGHLIRYDSVLTKVIEEKIEEKKGGEKTYTQLSRSREGKKKAKSKDSLSFNYAFLFFKERCH